MSDQHAEGGRGRRRVSSRRSHAFAQEEVRAARQRTFPGLTGGGATRRQADSIDFVRSLHERSLGQKEKSPPGIEE